jgi:hypothetical protein
VTLVVGVVVSPALASQGSAPLHVIVPVGGVVPSKKTSTGELGLMVPGPSPQLPGALTLAEVIWSSVLDTVAERFVSVNGPTVALPAEKPRLGLLVQAVQLCEPVAVPRLRVNGPSDKAAGSLFCNSVRMTPSGPLGQPTAAVDGACPTTVSGNVCVTLAPPLETVTDSVCRPLAPEAGGDAYPPTYENVAAATYPLSRLVFLNLNRAPGKPLNPALQEFLRFILSREGQRIVLDQAIYLPLRESQAARSRALLE